MENYRKTADGVNVPDLNWEKSLKRWQATDTHFLERGYFIGVALFGTPVFLHKAFPVGGLERSSPFQGELEGLTPIKGVSGNRKEQNNRTTLKYFRKPVAMYRFRCQGHNFFLEIDIDKKQCLG
jgi:hypothetical protein